LPNEYLEHWYDLKLNHRELAATKCSSYSKIAALFQIGNFIFIIGKSGIENSPRDIHKQYKFEVLSLSKAISIENHAGFIYFPSELIIIPSYLHHC